MADRNGTAPRKVAAANPTAAMLVLCLDIIKTRIAAINETEYLGFQSSSTSAFQARSCHVLVLSHDHTDKESRDGTKRLYQMCT